MPVNSLKLAGGYKLDQLTPQTWRTASALLLFFNTLTLPFFGLIIVSSLFISGRSGWQCLVS
jgi:hypothetical protein